MQKQRLFFVLRYFFVFLLAIGSFYLVAAYLATDYPSFLTGILTRVKRPDRVDHYLGNFKLLWGYKLVKYLLLLYILFLFFGLYNAVVRRQGRLSGWLDRTAAAICSVLSSNRTFWRGLDPFAKKGLFFIAAIQFVAFFFLLLSIPYHYDEAYSYAHFSGVGFIQTMAYYPYPNNHIFFNLVSRVFGFLPLQAEITTRLPSFFASLISTWYFFKLAYKYFSAPVSLFVTILFLAAYPVILYSIEGRGYGFLICCTVLLFYSAEELTVSKSRGKYRLLYVMSMVVGLYTVPSFLFVVLPVSAIASVYVLLRKQWGLLGRLVLDNITAGVVTALLYTPIIYFNGLVALSNPNDSARLSLHSLLPQILPHLTGTFNYLLGATSVPLGYTLIPIVLTLLAVTTSAGKQRLLPWLTAGMLLSPPVLLCLFPIIPFERTWVYLAIPLAFSIGFMVTMLTDLGKRYPRLAGRWQMRGEWRHAALVGLYAGMLIVLFANFRKKHREDYAIDYDIRTQFGKMGADIDRVRTVGYTGPSIQFYVADDLYFQCFKRNPMRRVTTWKRNSFNGFDDDVLVVAPDSVSSFKLANYQYIGSYSNLYSIFIRKY